MVKQEITAGSPINNNNDVVNTLNRNNSPKINPTDTKVHTKLIAPKILDMPLQCKDNTASSNETLLILTEYGG